MKKQWLLIKKFLSKKLVLISFFLIAVLFIGVLVWTFTTPNEFLVGGGSTSVQPALESLINEYQSSINNKSKILYNSIGSSAAYTGLNNKSYDFGFLSDPISNDQAWQLWNSSRLVRFVLARDYFLLVYHLPRGVTLKTNYSDNNDIAQDPEGKPALLLGTFENNPSQLSGVKQIQNLYNDKSWKNIFPSAFSNPNLSVLNQAVTTRITRENGSGTRSFFEKSVIQEKNYDFNQIVTSNGEMLSTILNAPNSIGYISFDYLSTLLKSSAFQSQKVGIFAVHVSGKPCFPYQKAQGAMKKIVDYDFNQKYPLSRPFTGLMNTTNKEFLSVLKFVAWMINPFNIPSKAGEYSKTYGSYWLLKNGVQPISFDNSYFNKYDRPFVDGDHRFKNIPSIFKLIQKYHLYQDRPFPPSNHS